MARKAHLYLADKLAELPMSKQQALMLLIVLL